MNCKYCGAELEADAKFCPECGKAQTEEDVPSAETAAPETAAPETEAPAEEAAQAEEAAPQTDEAAEAAPEAKESPTQEAPAEKPEKSEKKKTGWLLGGAIAVLVIVIALLVVKIVRDSQIKNVDTATTEETVADASTDAADPSDTPDDALDSSGDGESTEIPLNGVSYTVAADELTDEVLDRVVAECGDMTLTNRDLPIYYWQQYLSFANTYGMYLSYIMDTTLPLDQQMYDEENTWQQMFLNAGLSMFQYHAAAAQEAEKAGYQLSAESEQTLAELKELDFGIKTGEKFRGTRIPTFREFLELTRRDTKMQFNFELKDYIHDKGEKFALESASKAIALFEEYGLTDRLYINSFEGDLLLWIDKTYGHKYRLHGYYPYKIMGNTAALDVLYCICMFNVTYDESGKAIWHSDPICTKEQYDEVIARTYHDEPPG